MLKGAYQRAALKAEMKRALGRGERTLSREYLTQELGISPADFRREIDAAYAELPPVPIPRPDREGKGAGRDRHARTRARLPTTANRGRNG